MHQDDQAVSTLLREAADVGAALPCANNPQLWFSERPADLELAKAGCRLCPLRGPCLAGAVDQHIDDAAHVFVGGAAHVATEHALDFVLVQHRDFRRDLRR